MLVHAYIQGGKFWSGFASGSISSIVSSGWENATGNFAKTGFGTMFFGTISGGAGAALTGGNFWRGAVTGLMVSGLNHVMHSKPNQKLIKNLNKDLEAEFGNGGNDKAPANQKTLNRLMKLSTFRALNKVAGGKVDVRFIDASWSDSDAEAHYKTLRESNGELYTGSDDGYIEMYRSSFGTYRETAGKLIHEFGHAISRYSGFFANSYKKYKDWNKAIALDEVFAYSFQDGFGFSFYQDDSKYYTYGLQRALNKL